MAQNQNPSEVLAAASFPHVNYNRVLIRCENKLETIILINNMKGQTSPLDKNASQVTRWGQGGGERGKRNTNYVLFRRINQHLLKNQNQLITTALANLMLPF